MSEYWVSRKKYWCKYCNIHIADDAPSRSQHENGLRHKGNKERFVKNLYKQGESRKKDLDDEKREIARIEQAANEAFAKDVADGRASSSKSTLPPPPPAPVRKVPPKATSAFSNYSTAESLGFTDPDEEQRKLRSTQGLVGQWEIVAPPPPPVPGEQPVQEDGDIKPAAAVDIDSSAGTQGTNVVPEDSEDVRHFKIRKRKLDLGLDDLWDPGSIPIKLKAQKTDIAESLAPPNNDQEQQSLNGDLDRPKWVSKGWKRATQTEAENENAVAPLSHIEVHSSAVGDIEPSTKAAVDSTAISTDRTGTTVPPQTSATSISISPEADNDIKPVPAVKEEGSMAPTSLFRKRKVPAKR